MATQVRSVRTTPLFRTDLEVCIRTWGVDHYKIQVFRRGDELEYGVHNRITNRILRVPILPDEETVEQRIQYLKKAEVVVNWDESVSFVVVQKRFSMGDKEITLLYNGDLIWQLFDRATQTSSQILCDFRIDQPLERRLKWIVNSRLKDLQVEDNRLTSVSIEPVTTKSRVDPRKTIDGDSWAVTLITTSEYDPSNPTFSLAGHAAILFEGIKEGKYEMIKGDLVAGEKIGKYCAGKVHSYSLTTQLFLKDNQLWYRYSQGRDEIQHKLYQRKSATWIRTGDSLDLLIGEIQEESTMRLPCLFHELGSGSFWAQRKIYVAGEGIQEIPQNFENTIDHVSAGITDFFRIFTDNIPFIGRNWDASSARLLPEIRTSSWFIEKERQRKMSATRALNERRFIERFFQLQVQKGGENVAILEMENCITWAKKKLAKIDIHPDENLISELFREAYGQLITLPKAFTQRSP